MVQPSEQYLTADDRVQLFVRAWLPEVAVERVILCLHGMSSHSGFYAKFGYALAERGSAVYALDLRGNGLSGRPGEAESIDRQISDIHLVVQQIRRYHSEQPLHLLGHSLGAGYLLRYVCKHPVPARSLILLAPAVKVYSKPSLRLFLTTAIMGFRILLTPQARWDTSIGWPEALRKSPLGETLLSDPACVKQFTYRYTMGLMQVSGATLLRTAGSVALPTLILQGERDSVVAPKGAKTLYDRLATREKQFVALPDADHDLYGLLLPGGDELTEGACQVVEIIAQWLIKVQGA